MGTTNYFFSKAFEEMYTDIQEAFTKHLVAPMLLLEQQLSILSHKIFKSVFLPKTKSGLVVQARIVFLKCFWISYVC
jgi:hypothetical protein